MFASLVIACAMLGGATGDPVTLTSDDGMEQLALLPGSKLTGSQWDALLDVEISVTVERVEGETAESFQKRFLEEMDTLHALLVKRAAQHGIDYDKAKAAKDAKKATKP